MEETGRRQNQLEQGRTGTRQDNASNRTFLPFSPVSATRVSTSLVVRVDYHTHPGRYGSGPVSVCLGAAPSPAAVSSCVLLAAGRRALAYEKLTNLGSRGRPSGPMLLALKRCSM